MPEYRFVPPTTNAIQWNGANLVAVQNFFDGASVVEVANVLNYGVGQQAEVGEWVIDHGDFGFYTVDDTTFTGAYEEVI